MNYDPNLLVPQSSFINIRTRDAWSLAGFVVVAIFLPGVSSALSLTKSMTEIKTQLTTMRSDINKLSDRTDALGMRVSDSHAATTELRGEVRGRFAALTTDKLVASDAESVLEAKKSKK